MKHLEGFPWQQLGEDVSQHILGGTKSQVNFCILNLLPDEMVPYVYVFSP